MTKKAAILLADGFEEIEAITPFDLLQRAGIEVDLVSVTGTESVTGTMGLKVTGLKPMKGYDFSALDALILPGGEGYLVLEKTPEVIQLIHTFASSQDKVLGAICAASSILGKEGIYKGKDYTCVPGLNGDFGGTFENTYAVIDGNIVSGISVGGAFEFALDLITRLVSREKADQIAKDTCFTL